MIRGRESANLSTAVIGSSNPRRDSLALTVGNVVSQLSMFLFILYLARSVEVRELGSALVCISLATVLVALTDAGTNSKWLIDLSNSRLAQNVWLEKASVKIFIAFVATVFGTPITSAFFPELSGLFPIFFGTLSLQTIMIFLKVFNMNSFFAALTGLEKLLALIFLIAMKALRIDSALTFWVALSAASILCALLGVFQIARSNPVLFIRKRLFWANPYSGSSSFAITSFLGSFRAFDVSLVALVLGAANAGLYGSVSKWYQPIMICGVIVATITSPWFASKAQVTIKKIISASYPLLALIGASIATLFFPSFLVATLLGNDYISAGNLLGGICLTSICATLATLAASWGQALGQEKRVAWIAVFQIVGQFGLGLPSMLQFGLEGYIWASFISQFSAVCATFALLSWKDFVLVAGIK
jgi:O-antigen/teichoic acid export membrane protein